MSTRQRWSPVSGTGNRIYDARERRLVAAFDAAGGAWRALARRHDPPLATAEIRRVLVLRLDRIGDVLMSLPALARLRAALPQAHLTLAVGRWSAEIAQSAPVDEVVTWSAPWVGRRDEGADSLPALLRRARSLGKNRPDLGIDLQGDVRANLLLAASGARRRVGYANSGGAWLLDRVVPLDETVSWVEQNHRAIAVALGEAPPAAALDALTPADREFTDRLFASLGFAGKRPLVGLHPSGGRAIKQWDLARWVEVAGTLQDEFGATVLITGSAGDRPLAEEIRKRLSRRPIDLTGRLSVRETLAMIARMDLFLSPDTGPMHMACTVGTPSVAVFGPSDPVRYFSGGSGALDEGARHVVVRRDLWCSPCNLIRLPPEECARAEGGPECLRLVTPDDVLGAARRLLREAGFAAAAARGVPGGMKTLVFRGSGAAPARADAVAIECGSDAVGATLALAEKDAVDEAAIVWTKAFGRKPILDGKSFRELYQWKGVSLWWFAELFLHHSTRAARYVRLVETFGRILDRERPDEVEAVNLPADEAVLLGRVCTAAGALFHGPREARRGGVARVLWESRWNAAKALATATKARYSGPAPQPPDDPSRARVMFLSHAAFWRERRDPDTEELQEYEHYFDRLIPEAAADPALRTFVLAVGPRAAHRSRGVSERLEEWLRLHPETGPYVHMNRYANRDVVRAVWEATLLMRRAWRTLRKSPGAQELFTHRGVPFADLALPDLAATLLLQVPWAVRCFEEMRSVLERVRPAVVCLYAESSGWGRATIAACRAASVPTVAIQHGILYPGYYSYRHDADEVDAPRPDRTALFGESARRILVELGHYAPDTLVTTGSPKFDALVASAAQWDKAAIRKRHGVAEGERLLVVASRHQAIRETHASIGPVFPAFLRAVEALGDVRCLVKPHPAEPASRYEEDIRTVGATRTTTLPRDAQLMEILHAADALVTVESLAAVEALVLGCPVVVLNMPTFLREIVEAGAALGVAAGDDPQDALRRVLDDAATRAALDGARQRYLSLVAMGVDGRATERILALLRETAGRAASAPAPGMVVS